MAYFKGLVYSPREKKCCPRFGGGLLTDEQDLEDGKERIQYLYLSCFLACINKGRVKS